ncbi:uncharacterized protein L969DRAFT_17737 [Mixia osmundae IAM 14324]|uniref:RNA helicase n=1 Tax=Mixia osmundae (strain CBS 9802 / IAM 14324 / JCM 22182 / KY 12970) TaxID=764103 RepID=G7E1X1_MIXOS|nr:uncharacterized protein L969DRAFT_17737 [Mixia osmundae IAM 14324]KEI38659.1 hypothetical protein L969DRAFT_17737 [Mixia osmundae IAM 14324]GAA96884.1 hypothetical protein E5Q_03557 [Mixia osmundae IAM 14324]
MAGKDFSQYQYNAMSSLVLSADRSAIRQRQDEPTGEPETLVGRIDPKAMGSRITRDTANVDKKKRKAVTAAASASADDEIALLERKKRAKASSGAMSSGYRDIVDATDETEGIRYRPRTTETREIYQLLLSTAAAILGDQTAEVVRSAADLALETLKDANLKDFDKKKELQELFGATLTTAQFTDLINLAKKITDYNADETDEAALRNREGEIDDEQGVAVVFADEDAEDDEEGGYVVRDGESADDDDGVEDSDNAIDEDDGQPGLLDGDGQDDDVVIGGTNGQTGAATDGKSSSSTIIERIHARQIDGFWLQRLISQSYADPQEATTKTSEAMDILSAEQSTGECENALVTLFDFEHFDLVATLVRNRDVIVWCTRLARADDDEKVDVEVAMRERNLGYILKELRGGAITNGATKPATNGKAIIDIPKTANITAGSLVQPRKALDLEALAFAEGSRLMSNKKIKLPEGSIKRTKKGYEEIHVPEPKPAPAVEGEKVMIDALPEWTRPAFAGAVSLNRIQSRLYPVAFGDDEPILLCAPTGAGKTNVAMLTILNEIGKFRDESTGEIDYNAFKIVYIAPMKALVQEMVGSFGKRLEPFGIQVSELTGDRQLTKQQIAATQIIVTTPEKWDVITRKSTDTSYTNLVRLIIIDEIHLLHDDRGPVLESIVARTIRRMEQTQDYVRLVGLSATLPNYHDVARFLRVNPNKGLFYFDATYRPCPLRQQFVGVTEKRAIMRYQVMNEVCYEKVLEQAQAGNQTLVFVHSRKETAKTAKALRDAAVERETITAFIQSGGGERLVLEEEASKASDPNLKDLLPYGIAIHHAGMNRIDRGTVEELFAEKRLKVLVCTATLAWGVNLPAHCVVIKGTQIYNPEKGRWVELSPQDTLQMLGRAGRPQYDKYGESVVITNQDQLQYFLSMLNQQLPIESQFQGPKLADNLNAELVLGTIRNRDEGVAWLGYTYLFTRMLGSPALYGVPADYEEDDPSLIQYRADLIHTAAASLERAGMLRYDRKSGEMFTNDIGRVAAHYYINVASMSTYGKHLKPDINMIALFRIFSLSEEFKLIPVRQEEKPELAKLIERVPIPVKESIDEPSAKINILLQSYISQLKLDGFALVADMVYVTQSAGRILRAIFEICLRRGWAALTHQALALCQMVEKRMWPSMTPLRQCKGVTADIIRRAERKEFPWYRYFDLEPPELGELMGRAEIGRAVHNLVHQVPRVELSAHVQPITRTMLRIELTITPDFQWNERAHGGAESFWILVEDVDGEVILFSDQFLLRQRFAQEDHFVTFTVRLLEPLPPNYFISVISDRWMASETRLPISFRHLILPDKFPPPTPLLDLQPLPISALRDGEYSAVFQREFNDFNKIQTQCFQALFTSDDNVFVGAPTGSGKTVCAELALMRLWSQSEPGRAVCIEPYPDVVETRVAEWQNRLGKLRGGKNIAALTGETSTDLRILSESDLVICTPTQWDLLSRRWKQRKNVQQIALLIADELHLIGSEIGPTYEIVVSRTRLIGAQTEHKTRIIGFGASLGNARDLGEWMGANSQTIFNFSPGARPLPLQVHLQSFNVPHFPSLMLQMAKPAYLAIIEWAEARPVIAFVPSRKQCKLTATDLLTYCLADEDQNRFLNADVTELESTLELISDEDLKDTLRHGIGFYHEGLSKRDRKIVEQLYGLGAIQVIVASKDTAWSIPMKAHMVVLMGVQTFEGKEHRYIDYPFADVLQMMGRACRPAEDTSSRCVLMCPQVRKEFFKKVLNEGLPIESHLHLSLADHLNAEIVTKTVENKQEALDYLTWTYMYRRLAANANYYNLQGVSHRHISDHLSELVESTVSELSASKCLQVDDDMDLSALNLGMIAAYYNVRHITIDIFSLSLTERTKLKGLLEIVSSAAEFEDVPIRHREDLLLQKIYDRLPVKLASPDFDQPRIKTNVLLQAHFSRLRLPADLASDQLVILGRVLNLLSAMIDVMSSSAYLNATYCVDLQQQVVQAVWRSNGPEPVLKQIPHFTPEVIKRFVDAGVESVYDLIDLEDDDRDKLLQMDNKQKSAVAAFVNAYPSLEVTKEVIDESDLSAGAPITVMVTLSRGEDEEVSSVVAPFFPLPVSEQWWAIIGDPKTNNLLSIKKTALISAQTLKLEFILPQGHHELELSVLCGQYIGCDQSFELSLDVKEGQDSDEEDEEEEDEEMEDA